MWSLGPAHMAQLSRRALAARTKWPGPLPISARRTAMAQPLSQQAQREAARAQPPTSIQDEELLADLHSQAGLLAGGQRGGLRLVQQRQLPVVAGGLLVDDARLGSSSATEQHRCGERKAMGAVAADALCHHTCQHMLSTLLARQAVI
jgi:hypothetical protein